MARANVLGPLRWKRAKIHRGSRRRKIGPHHEAGYTSAVVTEPEFVKAVAIGRGRRARTGQTALQCFASLQNDGLWLDLSHGGSTYVVKLLEPSEDTVRQIKLKLLQIRFSGRARHQPFRSEVPSPGRWIRSDRKSGSGIATTRTEIGRAILTQTPSGGGHAPTQDRSTIRRLDDAKGIDKPRPVSGGRRARPYAVHDHRQGQRHRLCLHRSPETHQARNSLNRYELAYGGINIAQRIALIEERANGSLRNESPLPI